MFRFVTLIGLSLLLWCGCVTTPSQPQRQLVWTVPQVRHWFAEYRQHEKRGWDSILYQGSTLEWHFFIAYIPSKDDWAFFQIKANELKLADEQPYNGTVNGKLGYYFVDPAHGFARVRNF